MRYSLFAGGKRVRPILALASYEACQKNSRDIIPQAASVELVHTYSLIHDDLPSMDDDELRRGKPTNHKVFGEAMAILAGDALLTEAFRMMTYVKNNAIKPSLLIHAVQELAKAAGAHGMVAGQVQDILSENANPSLDMVNFIHSRKTAAMITACLRIGGILADAEDDALQSLTDYGERIGFAFQIVDDILDIEGTTEDLGKTSGVDQSKQKMTYPFIVGLTQAKQKAGELVQEAISSLELFSHSAEPLREIAQYLIRRRN
jgi:geranylgeranyl diphosphate synthase type II